jgi:hypothetical protein
MNAFKFRALLTKYEGVGNDAAMVDSTDWAVFVVSED